MLAPNVPETYKAVEGELRGFFREVMGTNDFVMQPEPDVRRLFGVEVKLSGSLDPAAVLRRLS
jgi:hypothetical protein